MRESWQLLVILGVTLVAYGDECSDHYHDEKSCEAAGSKCSWCKSKAVPSACLLLKNAKSLPNDVFFCNRVDVSAVKPPQPKPPSFTLPADFDAAVGEVLGGQVGSPSGAMGAGNTAMWPPSSGASAYGKKKPKVENRQKLEQENKAMMDQARNATPHC